MAGNIFKHRSIVTDLITMKKNSDRQGSYSEWSEYDSQTMHICNGKNQASNMLFITKFLDSYLCKWLL